jgi:pimeloyl-ACP methyl ester carboxylesterase
MTQIASLGIDFAEREVEAHGFKVKYFEAGSGEPVIVLHGAGGLMLTRAEALLAEKFRILALQIPGFGGSENERSKTVAELALTIDQVATNLGLEKYSLLGYSFGAKLALWLALQRPEHLDALVAVAPIAVQPPGGLQRPQSPEDLEQRLYAHPDRRLSTPEVSSQVREAQQAFLQRIGGLAADEELVNRLNEIEVPTLIVFGTLDGIISSDMGRHYREKIPNSNLAFVYDAAHAVNSDRPEALADLVSDYLERHEVFVVSRETTVINP